MHEWATAQGCSLKLRLGKCYKNALMSQCYHKEEEKVNECRGVLHTCITHPTRLVKVSRALTVRQKHKVLPLSDPLPPAAS